MAAGDTIIRVIFVPVIVTILIIIGWISVKVMDSVTTNLPALPSSLGPAWPGDGAFYLPMALGFVGLVLVVFIWLWVSPIREDQRQDVRAGRRF